MANNNVTKILYQDNSGLEAYLPATEYNGHVYFRLRELRDLFSLPADFYKIACAGSKLHVDHWSPREKDDWPSTISQNAKDGTFSEVWDVKDPDANYISVPAFLYGWRNTMYANPLFYYVESFFSAREKETAQGKLPFRNRRLSTAANKEDIADLMTRVAFLEKRLDSYDRLRDIVCTTLHELASLINEELPYPDWVLAKAKAKREANKPAYKWPDRPQNK